ncbi:MAG: hypothetical protein IJ146_04125 [Kiritimatiellae bacterium]|nr:hypothetical protein [Kiritimatiellia bacterium]
MDLTTMTGTTALWMRASSAARWAAAAVMGMAVGSVAKACCARGTSA